MKKIVLTFALALMACSVYAIQLSWNAPSADWAYTVTSGALLYTETANATIATDKLAEVIAFAKDGSLTETTSLFLSHAENASGSLWAPTPLSSLSQRLYVALQEATAPTNGTYFLVLFGDADKYAYATINVADSATQAAFGMGVEGPSSEAGTPLTGLSFSGTLVPEPTVLALLALGVAGVALRRKA